MDTQQALLIYTLDGDIEKGQLLEMAYRFIKQPLSLIEGVDHIEVYGHNKYEWSIAYKYSLLQELGIKPQEIIEAIESYCSTYNLGHLFTEESSDETFSLSLPIRVSFNSGDMINWESIPIKKVNDRIVVLDEVACIKLGEQTTGSLFRINGRNAVSIIIYPTSNANSINLGASLKNKIDLIACQIPKGISLRKSYDATIFLSKELKTIGLRSLITLFVLLLFMAATYYNFRYLLVILISLFVNLSISLFIYKVLDLPIHLYSLAGITVSFGLLIDNSIIMISHLVQRQNIYVFRALLAATTTSIAALSIILLLPENMRQNLQDFAVVIIVNLCISLAVSLFLIPALLSNYDLSRSWNVSYRRKKIIVRLNFLYYRVLKYVFRFRWVVLLSFALAFGLPLFLLPVNLKVDKWYTNIYNSTWGNEWFQSNIRPSLEVLTGGTLRLFSLYVFENSYYSKREETALHVLANLPKGSTVDHMDILIQEFEEELNKYSEIEQFVTQINSPENASIVIRFKEGVEESFFPYVLRARLIKKTLDRGGVNWDIYGVGKGFSHRMGIEEIVDYKLLLSGFNYLELEHLAIKLQAKLERNPRVKNVNISGDRYWWRGMPSYEFVLKPDQFYMAVKGISLQEMYDHAAQFEISGGIRGRILRNNEILDYRVFPEGDFQMDVWHLMNTSGYDNLPSLKDYSTIKKAKVSQAIYKENQNYIRNINYQYVGNFKFGDKWLTEVLGEMDQEMPLGYKVVQNQSVYTKNEEASKYAWLILLITILIFLICAILFESLLQPLVIVFMIPLSFSGLFLTFYMFNLNFDQGGYAAMIMLSGLVVNAAIYLVNEFNGIRRSNNGQYNLKIYLKAFNYKIIPILITILSTVVGLIPFLIGGQNDVFWYALAAGTIGGLIFSIVLIMIVLPIILVPYHSNK